MRSGVGLEELAVLSGLEDEEVDGIWVMDDLALVSTSTNTFAIRFSPGAAEVSDVSGLQPERTLCAGKVVNGRIVQVTQSGVRLIGDLGGDAWSVGQGKTIVQADIEAETGSVLLALGGGEVVLLRLSGSSIDEVG